MAIRITRPGILVAVSIIVMAGALIGGLLWAKHAGEQARRADAVKVAEERLKSESDRDVALNEGGKGSKSTSEGGSQGSGDTKQGSEQNSEQKDSTGSADSSQLPGTGANNGAVQVGELPQTGAGEFLASLVGLWFVVFAAVSYVRSVRL